MSQTGQVKNLTVDDSILTKCPPSAKKCIFCLCF